MGRSSQKQRKRIQSVAVDWTVVGRRIRELRGFDTTQQEFADRIGISQKYVSDMELGKVEIGAEIVLRIAREFDKSMEWLLTGEERPFRLQLAVLWVSYFCRRSPGPPRLLI